MQKHEHIGHRSRIRDRVRKEGLSNFQDYQVLEYALSFVIPYKYTNPLAHRLINKFGSLAGVLEADEGQLKEIDGMGEVSSHFLTSIIKIYNFYEKEKINKVAIIKNSQETYNYVKCLFAGRLIEELYMISLTNNNKIVKTEKVSQGTSNEAKVTIRTITDNISRNKVNNVIIAHNHPGGNCKPSADDDKFTRALVMSLALNDSFLIDHMIIGDDGSFYSYKNSGKIEKFFEEVSEMVRGNIAQSPIEYGDGVKDDKE